MGPLLEGTTGGEAKLEKESRAVLCEAEMGGGRVATEEDEEKVAVVVIVEKDVGEEGIEESGEMAAIPFLAWKV